MPSIDPPIGSLEGQPLVDPVVVLNRRKKGTKPQLKFISGPTYYLKKLLGKTTISSSPSSQILMNLKDKALKENGLLGFSEVFNFTVGPCLNSSCSIKL